jgi:hypothetical protein
VEEKESSIKMPPVSSQKPDPEPVQLQRADDSPAETSSSEPMATFAEEAQSREPLEILSPSRPRPPQVDLSTSRASIQRQTQDNHVSKEASESSPVNTAIGPLPADLWWLLGQKPPIASAPQPEIQRTIHADQKLVAPEQSSAAGSQSPVEHRVETPPTPSAIQRQALPTDALPTNRQEPAEPARAEKAKHKHAEPDLDDLARRVYAEVRRRLAAEWERRR